MERSLHKDRGGLTFVSDSCFKFFEAVQKKCDFVFKPAGIPATFYTNLIGNIGCATSKYRKI